MDSTAPVSAHETSIIEITDLEDVAVELTKLVRDLNAPTLGEAEADAFSTRCNDLIRQPNLLGLVVELVKHMKVVVASEDVENTFLLLFALVRHLRQESLSSIVLELCNICLENGTGAPETTFRILTNLYSIVSPNSPSRYTVYMSMVQLTTVSKNPKFLSTDLDNLKVLFGQWGISVDEQCQLLTQLNEAFVAVGKDVEAQNVLLLYLHMFEKAPEQQLTALAPHAARAALGFVGNPFEKYMFSIVHLAAVKNLSKVAQYKPLYELLLIFSGKPVDALVAFHKQHGSALESYGLSYETCEYNLRLLSLASLAQKHDSVTYQQLADELKVDTSEVEKWVVDGVTKNMIDAKIDQLNGKIVINKGAHRSFEESQWADMSKRVKQWKYAVNSLLQHVETARAEAKVVH